MPSLNPRQFTRQDSLPGFFTPEVSPQGFGARRREQPYRPPPPQPTHKRGEVGEGQRILNFDAPDHPLETSTAGLIPVDSFVDDTWDNSSWRFGGARRSEVESGADSRDHPEGPQVVAGWESAPVETIGPDTQIRTGQGEPAFEHRITGKTEPPGVEHDPDHVEMLRDEGDLAFLDPDTSEEKFPWVAQVEGKNYLMEGHHRAIAARTRDSGEFPAHVLRGANWGQIEEQLYDGPRSR